MVRLAVLVGEEESDIDSVSIVLVASREKERVALAVLLRVGSLLLDFVEEGDDDFFVTLRNGDLVGDTEAISREGVRENVNVLDCDIEVENERLKLI